MKKTSHLSKNRARAAFWTMLLVLAGCLPGAWAQLSLPLYEPFAYAENENLGTTGSSGNNWQYGNSSSSSSARIQAAANLSYLSMPADVNATPRGLRSNNAGKNRGANFSNPVTNVTIYASFFLNLQTNAATTADRLFFGLSSSTTGTGPTCNAGVWLDPSGRLKIGKNSTTAADASTTYPLVTNATYLVVMRYKVNTSSSSDDEVALWLNPGALDNNAAIPAPTLVTTNGTDAATMNSMAFFQATGTPVPLFYLDEIRVGTNWSDVTPTNSAAGNLYTVSGGGAGCVGDSFPVNLSGSDLNVSYLLYTNGVNSGISINGTGSAISYGPQSATATYTVLATNNVTAGVSWMPGSATITVLQVPTFTSQSGSVVAATNSTIQFTVTSGNLNIGYRWYRNGSPLSDNSHLTGSATSILTISPVLATDAATTTTGYYCIITNACGYQAISTTNALTIQAANTLVWQGTPANTWDVATTANWTNSAGSAVVFNQGDNVILDDTAQNTTVSLASPYLSPGTISYNGDTLAITINGSGKISGANSSLIVNGPSQSSHLTIANANSFGGGTLISNGWLTIGNISALGTGTITMAGTGNTLLDGVPTGGANVGLPGINVLADSILTYAGSGSYAGVVVGPLTGTAGKTLTLNHTSGATTDNFRLYHTNFTCNANIVLNINGGHFAPYNAAGTQVYSGVISGNGALFTRNSGGSIILNGANTFTAGTILSLGSIGVGIDTATDSSSGPFGPGYIPAVIELSGNIALFASGGAHTIGNAINYASTTNTVSLVFTGTNQLTLSGPIDLSTTVGDTTGTNRTFQVDNSTAPIILSGVIGDQGLGCGLIKAGNGSLYLNNTANTYTGPTTVSDGRLAGSGVIVSPVVVGTTNGGVLGGGSAAAIGTLTVNNNVTFSALNGGAFIRVNKSLSPAQSNDVVSVSGSLANLGTGTVTVTNLGSALQVGDTFKLFNKAVVTGNTMKVTGAGVTWTNRLAVDGSIAVFSLTSVATNPTNISFTVSGNNLNLSWPADHTGWILQTQTNVLTKGLSTNWFNVAGSTLVNQTNIVVNPANGSVFFRLVAP